MKLETGFHANKGMWKWSALLIVAVLVTVWMGATLWEEPERYIRKSPLSDFDRIETPVLIVQGTRP